MQPRVWRPSPRYLKHIYRVWAQERPGLLNCLLGENLKWRNLFHCNKVTLSKIGEQRENFLHLLVFFLQFKRTRQSVKGAFSCIKRDYLNVFQTDLFSPYSFLKCLDTNILQYFFFISQNKMKKKKCPTCLCSLIKTRLFPWRAKNLMETVFELSLEIIPWQNTLKRQKHSYEMIEI